MSRRQGPHTWQERKKYSKEDAHAVKLGVVLALEPQSNNDKIGTQVETAETQPSNLILYTNMNKDKTNQEIIEGRNERILAADLGQKRRDRGLPQIPRRQVKGAERRIDGRLNRLAGTVHDVSSGDQPKNWRDRRNHSAGMSAAKRVLGNPSPRTPPKNRDRKIITNSFNHGLDEGRYERIRAADIKKHGYTELAGRSDPTRAAVVKANTLKIARDRRLAGIVPGSANARPENRSDVLIHSARKSAEKRAAGKPSPRIAPKNRDRTIADSFNHGLEEAKRPTTRPIKQSKNIFGAGARGAVRGLTTPLPAGTSRTGHVLRLAMGNIARHVMDKFL